MQQAPEEYDEFAKGFNEDAFREIFGEETKEEVLSSLNDELPFCSGGV